MARNVGGRSESGRKSVQRGRGNPEKASSAAVERYLKDIDFPASKEDLVSHAEEKGAPEDVIKVIRNLDEKEYNSPVDVTRSVGEEE